MLLENGEVTGYGITEGSEFLGGNFSRAALSASLLPSSLTVNSLTVEAMLRYECQNASASGLTATIGNDLAAQGSGGTFGVDMGWNGGYLGFDGDGTRYFQEAGTSFGDLGTDDYVIELVYRHGTAGKALVAKRLLSGAFEGYVLTTNGANRIQWVEDGGANSGSITGLTTLTAGVTYHVMVFVNKDENSTNGSRVYLNGSSDATGANYSFVGDSSSSAGFTVGAHATGGFIGDSAISFVQIHKQASWFASGTGSHSEWAAVAAARYALLTD